MENIHPLHIKIHWFNIEHCLVITSLPQLLAPLVKVGNQLEGKTVLTEISTKSMFIWQIFGTQPIPAWSGNDGHFGYGYDGYGYFVYV